MTKTSEFVQYSDAFYEAKAIEHPTTSDTNNNVVTNKIGEFDNEPLPKNIINNTLINTENDIEGYDKKTSSHYDDGYQDGYQDGYAKKLEDTMTSELEATNEADSNQIKLEIAAKLESLSKNNFFDNSIILEFVNLVSAVSKKVVLSELSTSPEMIEQAVLAAINELINISDVIVECSTADFEHMPNKDNIVININPLMNTGEFSVSCSGQRIDSTFSSKIDDVIRNAFNVSK